MSPGNVKTSPTKSQYAFNITLAAVAGQVGCLTIFIVFAALFGGLQLDKMLDTKPMFTVGLMVLSVPVTLVLMFLVVRRATTHMRTNNELNSISPEKEDEKSE